MYVFMYVTFFFVCSFGRLFVRSFVRSYVRPPLEFVCSFICMSPPWVCLFVCMYVPLEFVHSFVCMSPSWNHSLVCMYIPPVKQLLLSEKIFNFDIEALTFYSSSYFLYGNIIFISIVIKLHVFSGYVGAYVTLSVGIKFRLYLRSPPDTTNSSVC